MAETSLIVKLGIVVIGVLALGLTYYCVKRLSDSRASSPPDPRNREPLREATEVTTIADGEPARPPLLFRRDLGRTGT